MGYTALYRKFRPQTFGEMVGQEHITRTLRNQIIANRVGHAYLFNGVRGTGKTTSAKILARAVNCLNPKNGEPCNECEICKSILSGANTDVVEMDAASNNSVEDIRAIREEVNFLPTTCKYRVYIIDEVHMLSTGAFNALLKTLEEPAPSTLFILISSEPQQLLPTIRSRCQLIPVGVPDTTQASAYLADAGVADASRWLAMAGGSPRLAIEMARGKQGSWLENLQLRLLAGKSNDPLLAATEMEKLLKESKGQLQLKQLVEAIQKWVVDLTLTKHGLQIRYFLGQENKISALADMIPATRLIQAYRALIIRRQESEQPVNARLFLESLFFDYRALFANR